MVQKSTEDHKWLFLLPFTWDVSRTCCSTSHDRVVYRQTWWAVTVSTILIGPLLYYVNKSCKFYDYYNTRNDKGLFKLSNCVWYTYGAIVGQGGESLPQVITFAL